MTPTEKAKQLIEDFQHYTPNFISAKRCAIILAQEVQDNTPMYTGNLNPNWKFWEDVKKELDKL